MAECLTDIEIRLVIRQQVSGAELARAEGHLTQCPKCRELLATLQRELERLQAHTLDGSNPSVSVRGADVGFYSDLGSSGSAGSSRAGGSTMHDGFSTANDDVHAAPAAKPQTIPDFQRSLTLSGLMTRDELDSLMSAMPSASQPNDVATMADLLVSQQKLTPYQAEVLREGRTRGLVLGNYVVLEKLGEGGMGMVFKAMHKRMKRQVALKVLPPSMTKSPDAIQRFHREVEAAAKLTHPNIAAAYDADEADGIHFMVMEFVDGPNLSSYVKQAGPMGISAALNLTLQAARGLSHAHTHGVIHRDIKPSNLLVNREGMLKVLDMGLARLSDAADEGVRAELTQSGRVMGTVDYMAPEQAIDAKKVDHRADIYSLGCTLYFLLTGKTLSPEGTLTQKLLWHQNETIPPLSSARSDIPPRLDAIYARMMQKKPDDRFQSMSELCDELDALLAEMPEKNLELSMVGIDLHNTLPRTDRGSSRGRLATRVESPTKTFAAGEISLKPAGAEKEKSRAPVMLIGAIAAGLLIIAAMSMLPWNNRGNRNVVNAPSNTTKGTGANGNSNSNSTANSNPTQNGGANTNPATPPTTVAQNTPPNDPTKSNGDPSQKNPPDSPSTVASVNTPMKTPVTPPEPPRPFEKLLVWVFRNGGQVTLIDDKGQSLDARKLEDVPRQAFEFLGINLDGTPVRDDELEQLADAEKVLRKLSLAGTKLSERGLAHLAPLTRLQALDLSRVPINNALASIGRLSELRELNLQRTGVSDQGLSQLVGLSQLEKLFLSDTQVGDAGVKKLENLKALRELGLNGTYVTDDGHAGLLAAIPQLKIHWDGKDLERSVAQRLLAKSAKLSLETRSSEKLAAITDKLALPRERFWITAIDFAGNNSVADNDLKSLAELAKVAHVNLAGTSVTPAGLGHLHGLASLKELELGSLPIPKTAVDALQNALKDCVVKQKPPRDLTVAEWVLARQGAVTIVTTDGDRLAKVRDVAGIPKTNFSLREIFLDDATLTDADLATLRDLPNLESLHLSGTKISNDGLASVVECPHLRELNLSGTKISSSALTSLVRFPNLQKLYLANTQLDSEAVKPLAKVEQLTHLSLAGAKLTDADLVELKRLAKLERLVLTGVPLTDAALETLRAFTGLKELLIDGTSITDAGAEELKVALAGCSLTTNPPNPGRLLARWVLQQGGSVTLDTGDLKKTTQLPRGGCKVVKVDFSELKNLRGDLLGEKLKGAVDLEELNLTGTSMSNAHLAGLAACPSLKHLHLGETLISDQGWASLSGLSNLETLDLHSTRVTGSSLKSLENLKALRNLSLATMQLTDRHLASLSEMTALTRLDLTSNSQITDKGVESLEKLTKLQVIGLRGCKLTDTAMDTLAKFPDLRVADLEGSTVSDTGVALLKDAKNLRHINLNKTQISDSTLSFLAGFPELRYVNASRTKVSDGAVETLRQALPNCHVIKSATANQKDPEGGGSSGGVFGLGS